MATTSKISSYLTRSVRNINNSISEHIREKIEKEIIKISYKINEQISNIAKQIFYKSLALVSFSLSVVFLSISGFYLLHEVLNINNTLSFLIIGLILFFSGVIFKNMKGGKEKMIKNASKYPENEYLKDDEDDIEDFEESDLEDENMPKSETKTAVNNLKESVKKDFNKTKENVKKMAHEKSEMMDEKIRKNPKKSAAIAAAAGAAAGAMIGAAIITKSGRKKQKMEGKNKQEEDY